MNKKDIEQLAAFITEDPREFHTESSAYGPGFAFSKEQLDALPEPGGVTQEPVEHQPGFSHSDIKVNAQEREVQKRHLAALAQLTPEQEKAQKFLKYIESVEHMSRSSLEY